MGSKCLFCENPVDSAEHIWSDWILEDLRIATPVRITVGRDSTWAKGPRIKIKCVCRECNNGWMSRLEETNKLAIKSMINDDPWGLTKRDQNKLVRWAVLKAMVLDYCNTTRELFYTDTERQSLKTNSSIPNRSLVWLGRFPRKAFHIGGTDIWGEVQEVPKGGHACVTTIIVGHLAIQVLTFHVLARFASERIDIGCKRGNWRKNLLDIWPPTGRLLRWPPDVSFTEGGPDSIVTLINRWKLGENIG